QQTPARVEQRAFGGEDEKKSQDEAAGEVDQQRAVGEGGCKVAGDESAEEGAAAGSHNGAERDPYVVGEIVQATESSCKSSVGVISPEAVNGELHRQSLSITQRLARIRLERSQPAHGEATSEGVDQALVGGDEISASGRGHRNVGAVVNGSVEIAGDLERFRQKSPARQSGKVAVEHRFESALRQPGCDGAAFGGLPEETADLEPEQIRDNHLNRSLHVGAKKAMGFSGEGLNDLGRCPLRGNARVHHERLHRSRSSRIMSSVEGNGPLPGGLCA